MPKKSKREKMLADVRRRVRTERVVTASPVASPIREHSSTFQFRTSHIPTIKSANAPPQQDSELIAIKRDLTKTVILATIAIASEFALYWFGKGKI